MSLPPLFDEWTRALLGDAPPQERRASCDDCVMCASPALPNPAGRSFDPRSKCCTYTPHLHNFLVGRILRDRDPALAAGRRAVEARLTAGIVVTPLGLGPEPAAAARYKELGTAGFGVAQELRCPYYVPESGGCGVWRHRNAICATYYCQLDRGAVGRAFWETMRRLLSAVSRAVELHCALTLGIADDALEALAAENARKSHEPERDPSAAGRRAQWGRWYGRERDYYLACADIADGMTWDAALALGGSQARLYAAEAAAAYRAVTSDALPIRLRRASFKHHPRTDDRVQLEGYSPQDQLTAPALVLELLPAFDGRPVADVLANLERDYEIAIEHSFVRKLVDFGILEPANEPVASAEGIDGVGRQSH